MKLSLILVLAGGLQLCDGAKILFVIPMPSRSHYNLGQRLTEELVKRGHQVTLLASFRSSNQMENLTEIIFPKLDLMTLSSKGGDDKSQEEGTFNLRHMTPLKFLMFSEVGEVLADYSMSHKPVKDFLDSGAEFDLVVGECFLMEGMLAGFGHRFKAPIVGLATFMPNTWANEMVGNPAPSSYIPEPTLNISNKMSFCERLGNFLYSILAQLFYYFKHLPSQDRMMRKYFGGDLPPLKDMISKTSLVLVNYHHVLGFPRAYLPNMVEIGGYHVRPPKPLPKDLQKFMDEAKDGVIIFSMGSNLKSSELPKDKFDGILKIFSKLKQKVLWKFEEENTPNLPSNVKISKWLPQSDILAHPNLKLFVTHGGLLSLTESVLRGVPVVGVPIFGDQPINMRQVEKLEIGVEVKYEDIATDLMHDAILEVLGNPKYAENVKYRSQLLRDVPVSQLDTAVFWIEYVIRHKGAPHLMSGAQDLAWYQLYLLDVLAVLGAFLFVSSLVSFYSLRWVWRTLRGGKSGDVDPLKKKD